MKMFDGLKGIENDQARSKALLNAYYAVTLRWLIVFSFLSFAIMVYSCDGPPDEGSDYYRGKAKGLESCVNK